MNIRKATFNDAQLLFEWANESVVRMNALNTNPILWDTHIYWLQKKLENNDSFVFIAEIDGKPIGQIRFDVDNSHYFIDYSVAKNERGKGYGFLLVKEGLSEMMKQLPKSTNFIAWVKPENTASKRVFEKLGFINKSTILKEQTELMVYELKV